MEYARVHNMMLKSEAAQPRTMLALNEVGNLVVAGSDYDFVPVQPAERVLILDDGGVLREAYTDVSYLFHQGLASHPDDCETPPHVLDHMYAKKPREPGTEQVQVKPRRRAKRKDPAVEQFIIPDTQATAPKINIIRQRLPTSVYNPLPSRPKILHGGGGSLSKSSTGTTTQVSSSLPKIKPPGTHVGGRASKKEDPTKTMYASFEESAKTFMSKNSSGGGSKGGGKPHKSMFSKTSQNTSAIMMDDLQRDGAGYDEMLFDFGITEDDEAITCTFSDGEFDEFNTAIEAYSSNHCQLNKSSKSTHSTSEFLLNKMKIPSHSQLPPEISDDDDSNQIMIHQRRSSQDWDSVQLFDQSKISCKDIKEDQLPYEGKQEDPAIVGEQNSSVTETLECPSFSAASKHNAFTSDSVPEACQPIKDLPPTRRSSRVSKTPAWLEDSDKIPIKRQRKKSSA